MKPLILTTAIAIALATGNAQAQETSWCEESSLNGNICIWGAVLGAIVVANLALDAVDVTPSDQTASSGRSPWQFSQEPKASSGHSSGARQSYPNWAADEGCAWGSRAYGTCQ